MLNLLCRRARTLTLLSLCPLITSLPLTGCQSKPELVAPEVVVAPYGATNMQTPVFAVAPLRNESGVSVADTLRVGDALCARLAEVRGIAALPLNRTISAMRALRMSEVRTPEDARRLAAAVGADALIVGSVTAYDPYDPPKMGLTLGLYARPGSVLTTQTSAPLDLKAMQTQPDETAWSSATFADKPLNVVSEHLDAANHEVLMNVQRYAEGRHRSGTALGWERYIKSMDLYTDFAASWAVQRLMQQERLRVARQKVEKPANR